MHDSVVLLEPTELIEISSLLGSPPRELAAGRQHSALVLANGEAWTWGSGQAGKLGLGTTQDVLQPSRCTPEHLTPAEYFALLESG